MRRGIIVCEYHVVTAANNLFVFDDDAAKRPAMMMRYSLDCFLDCFRHIRIIRFDAYLFCSRLRTTRSH